MNFRSSIAVFAVCEHCRSMIVLRGADAELIGAMAALPPDLSPFHIGTRGEWEGHGFEIVGRVRVEWEQGSWNEWCLLYDGTKTGWLAEAQGLLMISFAAEVRETLPSDPGIYRFEEQITLDEKTWTVSDVKTVTYRASEGELPFVAPPAQSQVSVDLMTERGDFATIEFSGEGPEVYAGEYVSFDALKLANLRAVPGWSTEVAQEKNRTTALSCPSCGAPVELRASGQSMAAVCGSCGAIIDTATPELKLIEHADVTIRQINPLLPIGQRGKLFGVEWEVIGLINRADQYSKWSEYLLFNPWRGFRWLVTFDGHWSFIERLSVTPTTSGSTVSLDGRKFKLFAEGAAIVRDVLGEFYWKVRRGERADVSDYIAPPFVLSKETYPGLKEVAWSRGEYVSRRIVAAAFSVDKLPRTTGLYLNQPNKYAARWKEIRLPFLLALVALVFIQISTLMTRQEAVVAEGSFVFNRAQSTVPKPVASGTSSDPQNTFATPRFTLTGGQQRVVIEVKAPVDNNWLGLDLNLVNVETNQSFPAAFEVSAYRGYDSDGAWSEGGQETKTALSAIPPGTYFVTVEPSADVGIQIMPFTVRVKSGGAFNSNFVLMFIGIVLYPARLIWQRSSFETNRWKESDYSP